MIYMKDNNELSSVMEIINREGLDGLSQAVEIILNEAMKVERSQHLKAIPYERTEVILLLFGRQSEEDYTRRKKV